MSRAKRLALYTVIGIVLAVCSLVLPSPTATINASLSQSDRSSITGVFQAPIPPGEGDFASIGIMRVFSVVEIDPPNVLENQSFTVSAEFWIDQPLLFDTDFDLNRAALAEARVSLNLAGATVEPENHQQLGLDLRAEWSVVVDQPGINRGFIGFSERSFGFYRIDFANQNVEFEVQSAEITQPFSETFLKPAALLLGLIIALTNIVRFFWDLKDRVRTSRAQSEVNGMKSARLKQE